MKVSTFVSINRVNPQFNISLVGSWLFSLTKPAMFGKLEVHALEVVWRFNKEHSKSVP